VRVKHLRANDCFDRNSCESLNGSIQIKHNESEMCIEKDKSNHYKIKWFKSRQKLIDHRNFLKKGTRFRFHIN
jgi:hypothetical protein